MRIKGAKPTYLFFGYMQLEVKYISIRKILIFPKDSQILLYRWYYNTDSERACEKLLYFFTGSKRSIIIRIPESSLVFFRQDFWMILLSAERDSSSLHLPIPVGFVPLLCRLLPIFSRYNP